MDNMKYYNDSLAYDFEMFMPRPAEEPESAKIVKMPRDSKKRKAATRQISLSAFAIMASVFVLAALCGNILLRLKINEVNSQINDFNAQINLIDSEKTELEVEFDRRISYSNIELEATEMGMQKMNKSQVKYIRVHDENTAVNKDGKEMKSNKNR